MPSKEVSKELGTGLNTKLKFQDQLDQSIIVSLTVLAGKATDLVIEPVQFSLLNFLVLSYLSVRLSGVSSKEVRFNL